MASKQVVPACGFGVGATKKGELPLRIEKRPRGKRVTLIPNVVGDASKLARALMSMLGVGGTARQGEKGSWAVEVQGEQIPRVTQALLEFKCIQGLTKDALEALRCSTASAKETSVVAKSDATKFLARTQEGKALSPEQAAAHGQYWNVGESSYSNFDLCDVWEDQSLLPEGAKATEASKPVVEQPQEAQAAMNSAFRALGMIAECGWAVRNFWDQLRSSGQTVEQFRRRAINPGARLIDEADRRKEVPSNLKSRQKLSDFRSGGARINYFSATCSVIDDYQRGIVRSKQEKEAAGAAREAREQPKMLTLEDAEGWCVAELSYCAPFEVPATRLDDEQRDIVSKKALKAIAFEVNRDLDGISQNVVGVECCLDCSTFGLNLTLRERSFLLRKDIKDSGKAPDKQDKEEMKLEKKLRDISRLRERELEGEVLEKLQRDKVLRRSELFQEVAELKLRRAEKQLLKIFKKHTSTFQDKFWDLEPEALYGGGATEEAEAPSGHAFGAFDVDFCDKKVTISDDGSRAESSAMQWVGAQLSLAVRDGEVGAFAVEVLHGLVRLGWALQSNGVGELGADRSSYGFGGTGKKVNNGVFEDYGEPFKAGDEIHCEAERDEGRLRIGFAKNSKPLGIAFDVPDDLGAGTALAGVVCGRGFKVRLISAEAMPLHEAPVLDGFVEYNPPRLAVAARNFSAEADDCLTLWAGETINVACDDGDGWMFGYFLDPEDPDDAGWFPVDAVYFVDEVDAPSAAELQAPSHEPSDDVWNAPPHEPSDDDIWNAPPPAAATASAHVTESRVQKPSPAEAVEGLADWLQGMSLLKYHERAIEWCQEMGALDVYEIEENWELFADELSLKPLERKRLAKKVAATSG